MTLIQDGLGSTLLQVEGFQKAARVCLYPNKINGSWSIAASTGLLTGVAAGGAIFHRSRLSDCPPHFKTAQPVG